MGIQVDGMDISDMVRGFRELARFTPPLGEVELRSMLREFHDCTASAAKLRGALAQYGL
jgi:hypothetical protein